MLASISWGTYLMVITLFTAIWYLYIGATYYRPEIQAFLAKRPQLADSLSPAAESELQHTVMLNEPARSEDEGFDEDLSDGFAEEIDEMISKIQHGVAEAITKQYSKEDLTLVLAIALKDHHELKDSAFGAVIEELILSECEKQGVHFYDENEIAALWDHEV